MAGLDVTLKKYFRLKIPFKLYLLRISSKIAFYPTLFSVLGILMVLFAFFLERWGITKLLHDYLPILVLEDGDTALTLLGVCIGGLISMMVFSFSMVMLLLSQASSNFSPRLLPGLISNKKHQIILGVFIATILYNLLILLSINPSSSKSELPGFSILMGIVFTVTCFMAFIYFIHTISQGIQINNIMVRLSSEAKERLHFLIQKEQEESSKSGSWPNSKDWKQYTIGKSGYFQNISEKELVAFCQKHHTKIHVLVPFGFFVLEEAPFFASEKELSKEAIDEFITFLDFNPSELVSNNYILGFKQLTEIICKAMSPSVNDPGTALNAIDYLTELFALRMKKEDAYFIADEQMVVAKINAVTFEELLQYVFSSLRSYVTHDPIIVQKLLKSLVYLEGVKKVDSSFEQAVVAQRTIFLKECLPNAPYDKKNANDLVHQL